ncbi:MAG TPA: STAS domain-containing protein [Chitinispirillaceae bacterium]|jgi:anti-sigma B factor antagonist|nr:STAS domain-containing protein [Chitinispirillaceae bacterium]
MKLIIHELGDITEVIIDGNVLQENIAVLRTRLHDLVDNGKHKLVINLVAVNYLSSMGLAVIVDIKNRVSGLKGDLKLALANHLISNLLVITNLHKKIESFDTLEEALKSFS